MADIKNYLREKEKRQEEQGDYKEKIKKHKLAAVYRVLIVLAVFGIAGILVVVQYKKHIYTGYDVVTTVIRDTTTDAVDIRLGGNILTYSKDGAHCTDVDGKVNWNQTYEIQDPKIAISKDVVAIGNYNGRDIYVQSAGKQLGTITTTMPIRNLAVSASGYVTAVLADTEVTWINTYDLQGNLAYYAQTRMKNSGYPVALGLSPNGELLAISYVYVDAGKIKTDVAFYNFGAVGANHNDYLVSVFYYEDMLVPQVQFMNDTTAFAVGDNRLMIYTGDQKPVSTAEHLYNEEVQSVFYNESYIGLVFISENIDARYRLDVFNTAGEKVGSYYFDIDYTDLFFEEEQFVVYNETECLIMTLQNVEKYRGYFSNTVSLMIPTGKAYKYVLVTSGSIDTIQLK